VSPPKSLSFWDRWCMKKLALKKKNYLFKQNCLWSCQENRVVSTHRCKHLTFWLVASFWWEQGHMVPTIKENKLTSLNISTGDFSSFTEVNLNELSLSHIQPNYENFQHQNNMRSQLNIKRITTRNWQQPILLNGLNINNQSR